VDPSIVLLLGLLVLVYLNFVGRRRAQRNRVSLQERLVPGAQVVTTSGLHATVTEVGEDGTVLLQTAPGQVTRWEKVAVGRVVDSPADAAPEAADEPAEFAEPAEPPATPAPPAPIESTGPTGEPSTAPAPEPGARPLPDSAPPDRA
jgi:preprotein translocase subunit YajC